MSAQRVAELQRQIAELSAELYAELMAPTSKDEAPTAPFLSIEDFAARLHLSTRTVRRMIAEGMPHTRPRKHTVRIHVARAEAWITARAATGTAAERPAHLDGPAVGVR